MGVSDGWRFSYSFFTIFNEQDLQIITSEIDSYSETYTSGFANLSEGL